MEQNNFSTAGKENFSEGSQVNLEELGKPLIIPVGKGVNPPLILTSLILVIASFQLNATMLSPAIGDMSEALGTNAGVIGWSTTIFLAVSAALAILLPPYADSLGRRKALNLSVTMMIVGTLIALFAPNAFFLILGRGLQGFCGATFALANLTLRSILSPKKYGKYLGIMAAVNSGVAGVDTLAGGLIVDWVGYRGILVVILLLEVIALAGVVFSIPETKILAAQKMDWFGALTMTGTLWSLNMVLTFGFGTLGWTSAWTIAFALASVISALAFIYAEKRAVYPLVPLGILAQKQFWGLLLTTFFTLASAFALLIFLIPALSQDVDNGFGMSGTVSALMYLTPFSLLGWIIAPLIGILAPNVGYRLLLRFGLLGTFVLSLGMCFSLHSRWILFILALLMGITYAAASNTTLNGLGILYSIPERPGVLPGMNSAAFNMGASVGIGIMASLVFSANASGQGVAGYRYALIVGTIFSALAFLFSLVLPAKEMSEEKI